MKSTLNKIGKDMGIGEIMTGSIDGNGYDYREWKINDEKRKERINEFNIANFLTDV